MLPREHRYILYIDFKAAYDSLDHQILFDKLEKFGFPKDVINTIKKIYSAAKLMIDPLAGIININQGVLQGSLISPILFNLCINDLIERLKSLSFSVMG